MSVSLDVGQVSDELELLELEDEELLELEEDELLELDDEELLDRIGFPRLRPPAF